MQFATTYQGKLMTAALAVLSLTTQVQGGIVEEGLWTDVDWYKPEMNLGVKNGVPYSKDKDTTRRIESAMALDGEVKDYMSKPNVKRVAELVEKFEWDSLFPIKKPLYEYEGFLRAVAKFPAFCGEGNLDKTKYDADDTCARELAALFAHFTQETGLHDAKNEWEESKGVEEWRQALYWITEIRCTKELDGADAGTSRCDYAQRGDWAGKSYPPQDGVQYYGRGPFQLSWNYNYGAFSKALVDSSYDGHMYLLKNPDIVHQDAYTVFAAALWFYMTPQYPKPSMHDTMAGFFVPTEADNAAGIGPDFGTTINIINGGIECKQAAKPQVLNRIKYYKAFLEWFGLPDEDQKSMECAHHSYWPSGGYSHTYGYFDKGWDWDQAAGKTKTMCTPVKHQTPYSVYTRDDYKRCVCDMWGQGAESCKSAEGSSGGDSGNNDGDSGNNGDGGNNGGDSGNNGGDSGNNGDDSGNNGGDSGNNDGDSGNNGGDSGNNGGDSGNNGGNSDPIAVSDPAAKFTEIRADPNYSDTEKSRTLYQVDKTLDYIEMNLNEIFGVLKSNNFLQ